MIRTLVVPARSREDAVVEAALLIERRGTNQRITGEPVKTPTMWGGNPRFHLWKVPVEDGPTNPVERVGEHHG